MGRLPIHSIIGVEDQTLNKGPWTEAEDAILSAYVKAHGEGNWRKLPKLAGEFSTLRHVLYFLDYSFL